MWEEVLRNLFMVVALMIASFQVFYKPRQLPTATAAHYNSTRNWTNESQKKRGELRVRSSAWCMTYRHKLSNIIFKLSINHCPSPSLHFMRQTWHTFEERVIDHAVWACLLLLKGSGITLKLDDHSYVGFSLCLWSKASRAFYKPMGLATNYL